MVQILLVDIFMKNDYDRNLLKYYFIYKHDNIKKNYWNCCMLSI